MHYLSKDKTSPHSSVQTHSLYSNSAAYTKTVTTKNEEVFLKAVDKLCTTPSLDQNCSTRYVCTVHSVLLVAYKYVLGMVWGTTRLGTTTCAYTWSKKIHQFTRRGHITVEVHDDESQGTPNTCHYSRTALVRTLLMSNTWLGSTRM